MGIQRVGHAVLKVRDMEVSKQFYVGVLGMKISSESPHATFFRFNDYHHDIGVFKVSENAQPALADQVGLLHIALVVDSEKSLVEMYEHLKAKGVKVESTLDHGMTHSLYIYDPDGNAIEIYCEVPSYDWRTNDDFVGYLKPLDLESL
ncbi:VOC family protein [Sphingobium sp. EM0848]|uniref:VOC family protein n=1 Tax=Sphingobium sp. EM0848 TaxID=2743473 RepID=UPI00159C8704|nr:VOC family protein [Sphingobium sp. EM0848]